MTHDGRQIIKEACEIITRCVEDKNPDTRIIAEQVALIKRENRPGEVTNATK